MVNMKNINHVHIYLYSLNENQIDMLCDFDNGILSYKIVDDKRNGRK